MFSTFGILLGVLGYGMAQDCTSLLAGTGKRFLLDDFQKYYAHFPREVLAVLPTAKEVDSKCRFDLLSLSDDQKQTLKTLYNQGYHLCIGCGHTDSDYGRCHSIDVCTQGSVCIRAANRDQPPVPSYYYHGCCNPGNKLCRNGDNQLHFNVFGRDVTMHYIKTRCDGPICNENGYTSEKNAFIAYLQGTATSAPATSAPATTTPAPVVDGMWGQWGQWSSCDKSCDLGVRSRTRSCDSPAPNNGGQPCQGQATESDFCNAFAC